MQWKFWGNKYYFFSYIKILFQCFCVDIKNLVCKWLYSQLKWFILGPTLPSRVQCFGVSVDKKTHNDTYKVFPDNEISGTRNDHN